MGSYVTQRKNPTHQDPYTNVKTVTVDPSEEQRSVGYQAPTPEMQKYIRKNIIEPTQKAYGVNPDTGDITPFQALGYNPEDEHKRREAEMALNDRKRKENAWYNTFAVLGDSVTAALGGNVWQRKPDRIGAQANADNQRLIAEQKAEDMNNAAILRNAGEKYADSVNRLIQNYLTKTTTINKTGGSRMEKTDFGPKNGYRYTSHVVSDGSNNSRNSGGNYERYININVTGKDGNITKKRYGVSKEQYKALKGVLKEHYNKILNANDEHSDNLHNFLTEAHVIKGTDSNGQYIYDEDQLLQNGYFWMLDDATKKRIEKETDNQIRFLTYSENTPSASQPAEKKSKGWGVVSTPDF